MVKRFYFQHTHTEYQLNGINKYIYTYTHKIKINFTQSAGAVEYTDCTSAEG